MGPCPALLGTCLLKVPLLSPHEDLSGAWDLVWGPVSALRDHTACSALRALCRGDHVILLACGGGEASHGPPLKAVPCR